MAKPTSIRVPEELLNEIEQLIKERNLDRSAYLREVLRKGFLVDRLERVLDDYAGGKLSLMEACDKLKSEPWEILSLLQAKNVSLNVQLEDWLDTVDLQSSPS